MGVDHIASTEQEVHAMIKVRNSELSWLLSAIYANPRISEHSILWNNVTSVSEAQSFPWIMMGDFNEVLMSVDKFGGRPVNFWLAMKFQNCLDTCGMMDMGFSGNRFTWTNSRGVANLIQERIDRSFCNMRWWLMYPKASDKHLTRVHSDHYPLLIDLDSRSSLHLSCPFRFQLGWPSHPESINFFRRLGEILFLWRVQLSLLLMQQKTWNKEIFGNIFARKRRLEA